MAKPPLTPPAEAETPEDHARHTAPEVLTPEEKRKLAEETSRSEDA